MSIELPRVRLASGYTISCLLKGGWQLAGGHGAVDPAEALADMDRFVDAGITTFDCADIYTGVEALIGEWLKRRTRRGSAPPVQVHTKYVPDLDRLSTHSRADVTRGVDRSLTRLGVECTLGTIFDGPHAMPPPPPTIVLNWLAELKTQALRPTRLDACDRGSASQAPSGGADDFPSAAHLMVDTHPMPESGQSSPSFVVGIGASAGRSRSADRAPRRPSGRNRHGLYRGPASGPDTREPAVRDSREEDRDSRVGGRRGRGPAARPCVRHSCGCDPHGARWSHRAETADEHR